MTVSRHGNLWATKLLAVVMCMVVGCAFGCSESERDNAQFSLAELNAALENDPSNSDLLAERGCRRFDLLQYDSAFWDFDKAVQLQPDDPSYLYWRAMSSSRQGMYRLAIGDFSSSLSLVDSPHPLIYLGRGEAYYELGELDSALKDLTRAISLDPQMDEAFFIRARVHSAMGMIELAILDYTATIELEPESDGAYCNRAIAKGVIGDFTGALEDYNRSIELNPSDALTYANRADAHMQLEDYATAVMDCRISIELDSGLYLGYYNLGLVYDRMDWPDSATTYLDAAIRLNPTSPSIHFDLAQVRDQMGDRRAAGEAYQLFLNLSESDTTWMVRHSRIRRAILLRDSL